MNPIILSAWPSTVEGWVGLISLIVGLVGAIAALIPTLIKLFKSLKQLVKEKNFKKIMAIADKAMTAAEESGKAGVDKKIMVIEAVKAGCEEAGIELDEALIEDLCKYIDETIGFFNDMKKASEEK